MIPLMVLGLAGCKNCSTNALLISANAVDRRGADFSGAQGPTNARPRVAAADESSCSSERGSSMIKED